MLPTTHRHNANSLSDDDVNGLGQLYRKRAQPLEEPLELIQCIEEFPPFSPMKRSGVSQTTLADKTPLFGLTQYR